MTPNDFWYDEPRLLNSYIKKRELELDTLNYQSWLIGLYVFDAVGVVLTKAFSKSSQKDTYFEKPLEQFNSNYAENNKNNSHKNLNEDYRQQKNYWSKFTKKGV